MAGEPKGKFNEQENSNSKKNSRIKIVGYAIWAIVALFVFVLILSSGEDEPETVPTASHVEKEEGSNEAVKAMENAENKGEENAVEKRISEELGVDDTVKFTEGNGYAFVIARAVRDDESIATEKLYRTVKTLAQFKEIDKVVINVQTPDGSRLLYKYTISGDKLRAIDFEVPGYGEVFNAADKLNTTF